LIERNEGTEPKTCFRIGINTGDISSRVMRSLATASMSQRSAYGAGHRTNHACEYNQHSLAGGFDDAAAVFGDRGINDLATEAEL